MTAKEKTLEKLEKLHKLYRLGGYGSELVERTLDKIIAQEIAAAQRDAADLQKRLQRFEAQYQMSSEDFSRRFQTGELGDDMDWVEWSIFYEMWVSVRERLAILESEAS